VSRNDNNFESSVLSAQYDARLTQTSQKRGSPSVNVAHTVQAKITDESLQTF